MPTWQCAGCSPTPDDDLMRGPPITTHVGKLERIRFVTCHHLKEQRTVTGDPSGGSKTLAPGGARSGDHTQTQALPRLVGRAGTGDR